MPDSRRDFFSKVAKSMDRNLNISGTTFIAMQVMKQEDFERGTQIVGQITNAAQTAEKFIKPLSEPIANIPMSRRMFLGRSMMHAANTVEHHAKHSRSVNQKRKAFRFAKKIVEL